MAEQSKTLEEECEFLNEKISQLEREIQTKTIK